MSRVAPLVYVPPRLARVAARARRPTPARSRRSRRPCRRRRLRSQGAVFAVHVESEVGARPSSIVRISPTKNVWSPVRISSTVRAVSQPAAPASRRGVVVAHVDAVPERDRRHARARSAARAASWSPESSDAAQVAGVAQQLVERRLARDRDADERRLERQRDERRDGQPGAAAVELGDDDARRPPATGGRVRAARPRVPARGRD